MENLVDLKEEEKVADGWATLGVWVLKQAVSDTHSNNGVAGEAHAFLRSSGAVWLVSLLGINPETWHRVMDSVGDSDYQLELPLGYTTTTDLEP